MANPLGRVKAWAAGAAAGPACEVCGRPLGPAHRHLLRRPERVPACACDACALLFERGTSPRFVTIPTRTVPVTGLDVPAGALPVGLFFAVKPGAGLSPEVYYPGPAGAVRGDLPPGLWAAWEAAVPVIRTMREEVEALWVDQTPAGIRAWVMPVDRCFDLVGRLRLAGPDWQSELEGLRSRPDGPGEPPGRQPS